MNNLLDPTPTETQIALLMQFNEEVVKPFIKASTQSQQDILTELKNLNFVTHKELDGARKNVRERFEAVETKMDGYITSNDKRITTAIENASKELDKRVTRREAVVASSTVLFLLAILAFIADRLLN